MFNTNHTDEGHRLESQSVRYHKTSQGSFQQLYCLSLLYLILNMPISQGCCDIKCDNMGDAGTLQVLGDDWGLLPPVNESIKVKNAWQFHL